MASRRFGHEEGEEDMEEVEEDIEIEEENPNLEEETEFEITQGASHPGGSCAEDDYFDSIVGQLQDAVMSADFSALQTAFYEQYAQHFTADEENKLIYTTIFQAYLGTIERYIEDHLVGVQMEEFAEMLKRRQAEIDGPLFEMLLSFSDFQVFKEMMLDYKRSVGGLVGTAVPMEEDQGEEVDLSESLCITSLSGRRK